MTKTVKNGLNVFIGVKKDGSPCNLPINENKELQPDKSYIALSMDLLDTVEDLVTVQHYVHKEGKLELEQEITNTKLKNELLRRESNKAIQG